MNPLKATTIHILIESLKAPGFFGADGMKAKQCLAKMEKNSSLQPKEIAQSLADLIRFQGKSSGYFEAFDTCAELGHDEHGIERWLLGQYFTFISSLSKIKDSEQMALVDVNKPVLVSPSFKYESHRAELRKFELAFAVLSAYRKQLSLRQQHLSVAPKLVLERLQTILSDQLNALDHLPVECVLDNKMRNLIQDLAQLVQDFSVKRITTVEFNAQAKQYLDQAQTSDLNRPDSQYQSTISALIRFFKNLCAVLDVGQYMGYQPMLETYNPVARALLGRSHFLMTPKRTSLQKELVSLQAEFTKEMEVSVTERFTL